MLGADEVCFLIMDLGGRAVARFGGTAANAARQQEPAPRTRRPCRLPGTVYEKVLRSQEPDLRAATVTAARSSCRSPTAATPWA